MLRSLRDAAHDFRDALRGGDAPAAPAPAGRPGATPAAEPVVADPAAWDAVAAEGTPAAAPRDPAAEHAAIAPAAAGPAWRRWALPGAAGAALLVAAVVLVARWGPWNDAAPTDPTVVATHRGGVVTGEDLRRKLEALPRAEQPRYRTLNGLRLLVGDLVLERTILSWAQERRVDQQEAVKDAMKHATEDVQLADVSDQLHEGRIPVGEAEIQAYYEQNRQRFGDRPLVEVREQVRQAVVEQKEQAFVETYLQELKERASVQVDAGLLDVPEPTEAELEGYYQANREYFRVPERATIAQVQVSVSLAGGDEKARARAESARARAAAGEDLARVAGELSDGPERARGGPVGRPVDRGSRGPAFDAAVFPLGIGELSPVFKEGDSYYVVKLLERAPERLRPYQEVRSEIADLLRAEREQQVYQERASRTLFAIRGRRTTLGEFLKELEELPAETRAQYAGPAGKRKVLDGMIERLLVVEDASSQAVDVKRKDDIEHARVDLLAQFLHDEEVDARAMQVADEELRAAYERDRAHYDEPPRVKVRYIRVGRGPTADADQRARAKIAEAEAKLRPAGLFGGQPADFGEVARQYSEDPATAAQGGALDRWIAESGDPTAELFEHRLHEELFPLAVGEVSRVVAVGDSYYLFQIAEKQEARPRPFEEARELVRRDLQAHKHEELTARMQDELQERAQLRIYEARLTSLLAELAPAGPPR